MKKDSFNKKEEVEYKTKAGTAWSHSFLNQKPWHPLSYPNQRRKWIAEQTHAEHERRAEEVSREFAQEQEFFRTSAMLSKKEREKMEAMQAVSFMYMRPPGYNAESARAAEIADEKKLTEHDTNAKVFCSDQNPLEGKKPRVKDLYGRTIPTEEEFPVLKNAPRLESGATARVKPFGVEIRNVKCARCGAFGHQSGDRECPMKDSITASDAARQLRDDPLTSIMNAVSNEPLKWELKQRPGGMSPPRGGFKKDDPNQQIVAEDIYDEYGGFLAGGSEVQDLLASFPGAKHNKKGRKKKRKEKHVFSYTTSSNSNSSDDAGHRQKREKCKNRRKDRRVSDSANSSSGSDSDSDREHRTRRKKRKVREKERRGSSNISNGSNSESERERRIRRKKRKEKKKREGVGGRVEGRKRRGTREV